MFAKGIEIISKAIFPIFYLRRRENQTTVGVIGTGFFIDDDGGFLTACHVINGVPEGSQLIYLGNLPYRRISNPVNIEEIKRNDDYDIFMGRILRDYFEPVELASDNPPVGKSLCLCGYPMPILQFRPPNRIDTRNVRVYYQPSFVLDGFTGNISVGGRMREYKGFITRDTSYPGMSGGPVFDVEGIVYGMDVACFHRTIQRGPNPIPVDNGISINCERLLKFINEGNRD